MVTFGAQGIVSVLGWLVRLSANLHHATVCDGGGGLRCRCSFLVPAFFNDVMQGCDIGVAAVAVHLPPAELAYAQLIACAVS